MKASFVFFVATLIVLVIALLLVFGIASNRKQTPSRQKTIGDARDLQQRSG